MTEPEHGSPPERMIERPIFLLGAPCSGAEQLLELLSGSADVVTLDLPVGGIFADAPWLLPAARGWDSARLGQQDAKPHALAALDQAWARDARGIGGAAAPAPYRGRLVTAYAEAALQVPFLHAAYPGAQFVLVQRDVTESLGSLLEAWTSRTSVSHPDLPGWDGDPWSSILTPEWRKLRGADLPQVVADQWRKATEFLLADLRRLPAGLWTAVGWAELQADPSGAVARLCDFLGLTPPVSTDLPPAADDWRRHVDTFAPLLPALGDLASRARETVTRPAHAAEAPEGSRFRSVSTPTFAELLEKAGSSLLATTYQSGRLVVARAQNGSLNTHFRQFESPMGIAYGNGVLSLGTKRQVWNMLDMPGLARQLTPEHDACFAPRSTYFTGDIRIHDIAWAQDQLWGVATRFSCLVTFDGRHSFVPRWRPPFITKLAPEDRCHLNGLAVVDGRVKYVTALGTSDTEGGWRPDKAHGGVIMDVETDEIIVSGLSMPHSPRWYRDRLWVLESGQGTLATVDLDTGKHETVAELPGFTRGLAFLGRYALVGLSEVREATTFGGLPLTSRLENRQCGVWVVDIESGETVGYLRFEDFVEEIFDVAVLPGVRYPEVLDAGADAMLNNFLIPPETAAWF